MKLNPFMLFAFFITPSIVMAGPFGSEMGMNLNEMKKIGFIEDTNSSFMYRSKSMKKGYPDAEFYHFIITPKSGLCKISVSTIDFTTNSDGSELATKFGEIKSALADKYGSPTSNYDFLNSGSMWKDSNDWMMALLKKERSLSSYWVNKKLADNIKNIGIETFALSNNKGYISFEYEFNNWNECEIELKSNKNKNI